MSPEIRQIGVRLPAELRRHLEEYARTAEISLSELMRRAVKMYLDGGSEAWNRVQAALRASEANAVSVPTPEVQIYGEWMTQLPQNARDALRQIGDALADKEGPEEGTNAFPRFLAQTSTGVTRLDFREPIPLSVPEMEQIEHGFRVGCIGESNELAARLHGYESTEEFIGTAANKILLYPDANNLRVLQEFVRNGYRLLGARVNVLGSNGEGHPLHLSLLGTLKNGYALNVWSIVQDAESHQALLPEANSLRFAPEGTWCVVLREPIETSLPAQRQVQKIFREGSWSRCSSAFARVYGVRSGDGMEGLALEPFLPSSQEQNRKSFEAFVRSGYHLIGAKLLTADRGRGLRVVHSTMSGHVVDGELLRIWGTQQDVTDFL